MRLLLLASLTLVLPLAGCVTPDAVAKTRAASDFSCSEGQVEVTSIGGNSYRANGCGRSAVYDCAASDSYRGTASNYTCVPEQGANSKGDSH
jgi:hypothetical protein